MEDRIFPMPNPQPRPPIVTVAGSVYVAPVGYTPMGVNKWGVVIASNGSDVVEMVRIGQLVQPARAKETDE